MISLWKLSGKKKVAQMHFVKITPEGTISNWILENGLSDTKCHLKDDGQTNENFVEF